MTLGYYLHAYLNLHKDYLYHILSVQIYLVVFLLVIL